jgi:dephospho-CoA kinase
MLRVALTGGIATGKSYVCARVESHGVPAVDADRVVHGLFAPGTAVVAAVAARFGAAFLAGDGSVDRAALGRLVFSDPGARADLEAIVHPAVYERIFAWARQQEAAGSPWALADIPLLFETGRQDAFDRVVVAACPPEVQVRRLLARGGLDEAAARARLAAQWPIGEKRALATDVIDTAGTFDETNRQVDALCAEFDRLARARSGA